MRVPLRVLMMRAPTLCVRLWVPAKGSIGV